MALRGQDDVLRFGDALSRDLWRLFESSAVITRSHSVVHEPVQSLEGSRMLSWPALLPLLSRKFSRQLLRIKATRQLAAPQATAGCPHNGSKVRAAARVCYLRGCL